MKKPSQHALCIKMMNFLQRMTQYLAILIGITLIAGSVIIIYGSFLNLFKGDVDLAIQNSLFVLILLEIFYVVGSFVKYNSINVGLIVNVGIIAAVKEMVIKLESINWELALSFSIIFITLGALYWTESQYYKQHKEEAQKMMTD